MGPPEDNESGGATMVSDGYEDAAVAARYGDREAIGEVGDRKRKTGNVT